MSVGGKDFKIEFFDQIEQSNSRHVKPNYWLLIAALCDKNVQIFRSVHPSWNKYKTWDFMDLPLNYSNENKNAGVQNK